MAIRKRKKVKNKFTGWAGAFRHNGRDVVVVVKSSHRPHAITAMKELGFVVKDKEQVKVVDVVAAGCSELAEFQQISMDTVKPRHFTVNFDAGQ